MSDAAQAGTTASPRQGGIYKGSPSQLSLLQLLPAAKMFGAEKRATGGAIGCVGCCDQ